MMSQMYVITKAVIFSCVKQNVPDYTPTVNYKTLNRHYNSFLINSWEKFLILGGQLYMFIVAF